MTTIPNTPLWPECCVESPSGDKIYAQWSRVDEKLTIEITRESSGALIAIELPRIETTWFAKELLKMMELKP